MHINLFILIYFVFFKFSLRISEESWITQEISLDAVSPFICFHTQVEWHENRKFLKVEFPVNVRSPNATYEIQFGHLQRPTHFNTSWDWARYEVCGQKWFNLSEHNWGCSIMNNNKYGFSTRGNIMSISLLRAPKSPDNEADMGSHDFKYAVFPHTGNFQDSGLIQHSYNFNNKIRVVPANVCNKVKPVSFFQLTNEAIVLETVKKAENEVDALVLRAYESFGGHNSTRIVSQFGISKVQRCDLLERPQEELPWKDDGLELEFKPFEIITLICFLSNT
ncbi:alpha-mannosidase 2C1-like [Paramuricea clavata]|uniref:Alpha-mannosidase 2C1-like n=1 Tax=Paramuricea clavata TaxID=317549 RepID=A0A7D9DMC5_PARCT|nr:alpha-mannosidase 2C1-like [Paramuricea clavata]